MIIVMMFIIMKMIIGPLGGEDCNDDSVSDEYERIAVVVGTTMMKGLR